LKVLKCGAGEGWRSGGPIVRKMKYYIRITEERNILHEIKHRKANWIGHILRRNYLLKDAIEGKIEGTRTRGRIRKQLLNDLKDTKRDWKLKESAPGHSLWRTRFGRSYGSVVRLRGDDDCAKY
jgi:hypothetical protein